MKNFVLNLILFLIGNGVVTAEELAPPRLWKATAPLKDRSGSVVVYVLGITHYGLPTEYDDYFFEKVIPAFQTSDKFFFEGAGNGKRETYPVCAEEVYDENGKKELARIREEAFEVLFRAKEKIYEMQVSNGFPERLTKSERREIAQREASYLDEYALVTEAVKFKNATVGIDGSNPAVTNQEQTPLMGSIVGELLKRKPNIAVRDVDSQYGARRAYCSSGPERIAFLRSELHSRAGESVKDIVPQLNQEFSALLSNGILPKGSINLGLAVLDRTFICERNEEWVRDIDRRRTAGTQFYALGFRHLFRIDGQSATCRGILADLTSLGWKVNLVN